MAKNGKRKGVVLHDTDKAAKNIWLSLLRDFRLTEGERFAVGAEKAFFAGVTSFREYSFPDLGFMPARRYKRWLQMNALLKKYRFQTDLYTDEELENRTLEKFFKGQEHFASKGTTSPLVHMVLQCARKHAKRILGKYDPDATVESARFGKKSSIGCPFSLAYIDHKLTDVKAFSGSSGCSKWFFEAVLPGDPILQGLVKDLGITLESETLLHESLTLVNVPKTWKVHRPITPLTLLSLFYSYGVGAQVEKALRAEGLNIATLQAKHARLVARMSEFVNKDGFPKLMTMDLSQASNSLLSDGLNRVLPREWFNAIRKTFSRQLIVRHSDSSSFHYTESVLPMGNGLTFPVETLVFYCILKAIAELAKVRGTISVYGDDLIFPVDLHKYVAVIFPQLKFGINAEKTFASSHFRESCGSDYYRGTNVRPCFLPTNDQPLTPTKYAHWLYKALNGLRRRWHDEEIKETVKYILVELTGLGFPIYRVPPSYPDGAGIRVEQPCERLLEAYWLDWAPVRIYLHEGSRQYHFKFLVEQADKRVVKNCLPYYWLALQSRDDIPYAFWETDFNLANGFRNTSPSILTWKSIRHTRYYFNRGKKCKKVKVKGIPQVSSKTKSKLLVTSVTRAQENEGVQISDWIPKSFVPPRNWDIAGLTIDQGLAFRP